MSNKVKFLAEEIDGKIKIEVEGSLKDLVNLIASAIDDNEDIERIFMLSFLAVKAANSETDNGDDLTDILSKIKPVAQA
jgi:hypothetical protein